MKQRFTEAQIIGFLREAEGRRHGGGRGSAQDRGGPHAAVRPWMSRRANGRLTGASCLEGV